MKPETIKRLCDLNGGITFNHDSKYEYYIFDIYIRIDKMLAHQEIKFKPIELRDQILNKLK